jgi:hypothetical protein
MAKYSTKRSDGTDTDGAQASDGSVSSPDVTEVSADAPVSPSDTLLGTKDVADGSSVSPTGEPAPSADAQISAAHPPVVASTALGADKLPVTEQDPIFGTQPAPAPSLIVDPLEDQPVQTDRPSYAKLLAAAQRGEQITIRQIRARPSNQLMVGGIVVGRELKTVSLDLVLDHGRGAVRELATDDTIEVYLVPEI